MIDTSSEAKGSMIDTFLLAVYSYYATDGMVQDLKNIKNVKRCRDGMWCSYTCTTGGDHASRARGKPPVH